VGRLCLEKKTLLLSFFLSNSRDNFLDHKILDWALSCFTWIQFTPWNQVFFQMYRNIRGLSPWGFKIKCYINILSPSCMLHVCHSILFYFFKLTSNSILCTVNRILLARSNQGRWDCARHVGHMKWWEMCTEFLSKPEGMRPFGRPSNRWEYNIRMKFRGIGWESSDCQAQDRGRWRAFVKTVINFIFDKRWGVSWLADRTINFSIKTHGVR
jgi:hypothetical protein